MRRISICVLVMMTSHCMAITMDLSGTWSFRLDPNKVGIEQKWYQQDLPDKIQLPGSLQEQGYGHDISQSTPWISNNPKRAGYPNWFTSDLYSDFRKPDSLHYPYWLQPEKHYIGYAWYQKTLTIPKNCKDKHLVLDLERCHWQTQVWVDSQYIGSIDSLVGNHCYDLSEFLSVGKHKLTLLVDNSMIFNVGVNAHSVSDHTQSAWNGIIGRIALKASDLVWIDDIQVFPNIATHSARIKVTLGNRTGKAGQAVVHVSARQIHPDQGHFVPTLTHEITYQKGEQTEHEFVYDMTDNCRLWDEFNPALYELTLSLNETPYRLRFGMREFTVDKTQFSINNRRVMLRGTLECCIFPLTGYPSMDVDAWKHIFTTCKQYGLNHVRFHSWCPPKAAFTAADEVGIYLQAECSV